MLMGSQVMVCSQVKVSGVSQRNSDSAFSYKREVDGVCDRKKNTKKTIQWLITACLAYSRSQEASGSHIDLKKDVIYTRF